MLWRHLRRVVLVVLGGLSLGAVLLLTIEAWATSTAARDGRSVDDVWGRLAHLRREPVWAALVASACGAAWLAIARFSGTRARRRLGVPSAIVLALGALTLAGAAYAPCVTGAASAAAFPAWVLQVFVGSVESSPPGSVCSQTGGLPFALARSLGLTVSFLGAIGVLAVLAGEVIDRWIVARSGDSDVVVGLDDLSKELVLTLVEEHAGHIGRPQWVDRRPGWLRQIQGEAIPWRAIHSEPGGKYAPTFSTYLWWWLTGLRRGDTPRILQRSVRVVVIDSDPQNPRLAEVRRAGALVLVEDSLDEAVLTKVLTKSAWRLATGRRRVCVRRLFAVTTDQDVNADVVHRASKVLRDAANLPHRERVVPRLFALMEDPREATRWRLQQLGALGSTVIAADPHLVSTAHSTPVPPAVVIDALSLDGIAAEGIVRHIVPPEVQTRDELSVHELVVVGDSGLALALLDELAWQMWRREDFRRAHDAVPSGADPVTLGEVLLCGDKATARVQEWGDHRAPWSFADGPGYQPFSLTADEGDPEDVCRARLARGATVIFVEDVGPNATRHAAMAARLSRGLGFSPTPRVILKRSSGPVLEPSVSGGILRVGPRLVVSYPGQPGRSAPEDSMTRLAYQQHHVYSHIWPTADVESVPVTRRQSRAGTAPWPGLPNFYREDNIRQHWQVLEGITAAGFSWVPLTNADVAAGDTGRVSAHERMSTLPAWHAWAESEQRRWIALRLEQGWWPVSPSRVATDVPVDVSERRSPRILRDSSRVHPLISDDPAAIEENKKQLTKILARMEASGITIRPFGSPADFPGGQPEQL